MPSYLKVLPGSNVPATLVIAAAAVNARNALLLQSDTIVTSGNDKTHMHGSKHYTGEALDFRTRDLTANQQIAWADEIRRRLGPDYDVVIEGDHLHIEHDPK